jgi:photosystem II stability/assembly factor-like uncharacterized protein
MKKIITLLFFLSLFSSDICFSQSGWFWQNPLPQGNDLASVQFLDLNTGYSIGKAGCFMKTSNGGLNWSDNYFVGGFESFDNSPKPLNGLFFIDANSGFITTNSHILHTSNQGNWWDTVFSTSFPPLNAVFFPDSLTGYCCSGSINSTYGKIYKTTNKGVNWIVSITTTYPYNSVFFVNVNTGWFAGYYQIGYPANIAACYIFKTTNGGISYTSQLMIQNQSLKSVFFVNENTGWAVGTKIWKTTDSGITWDSQNISAYSISFINSQTGYCVNDLGVLKSTNGGTNWHQQTSVGGNSISVQDINNVYVVGNYGTLTKSSNGGINWLLLSSSVDPENSYLYSVNFANDSVGYIISNSGSTSNELSKMLKTTNGGLNWYIISILSNSYMLNSYFHNQDTGWVAGRNVLKKTTNGGINWNIQNYNLSGNIEAMTFLNASTGWIHMDANGTYVLKTTNGGENWNSFYAWNYGLAGTSRIHFFNENSGLIIGGSGELVTSNGGINWQFFTNNYSFDYSYKDNLNNLYACNYTQFYISTDYGNTWQLISNTAFPHGIFNIVMVNPNTGYIFGLYGKLYKTTNGGVDWYRQYSKFGSQFRSMYFVNENTGWVVGDGGAILSTFDGGGNFVGVNFSNEELLVSFSLSQNYPNPFNPVTRIKYDIPLSRGVSAGRGVLVKLIIYDILGREIETLVNESQKPGSYEVTWDGSRYASGVYFYRLITDDFVETKKMVLIK